MKQIIRIGIASLALWYSAECSGQEDEYQPSRKVVDLEKQIQDALIRNYVNEFNEVKQFFENCKGVKEYQRAGRLSEKIKKELENALRNTRDPRLIELLGQAKILDDKVDWVVENLWVVEIKPYRTVDKHLFSKKLNDKPGNNEIDLFESIERFVRIGGMGYYFYYKGHSVSLDTQRVAMAFRDRDYNDRVSIYIINSDGTELKELFPKSGLTDYDNATWKDNNTLVFRIINYDEKGKVKSSELKIADITKENLAVNIRTYGLKNEK